MRVSFIFDFLQFAVGLFGVRHFGVGLIGVRKWCEDILVCGLLGVRTFWCEDILV